MKQDRAWLESAAAAENQWVRAVILKKDHLAHGDALEVASNARDMASSALGEAHPAYGVALLNMATYYEFIANDRASAEEIFAQARKILGDDHAEYVEGLYWLGYYLYQDGGAAPRAMELWTEALAIQRRRADNPTRLADLLLCLGCGYLEDDPKRAAVLLGESLRLQRKHLGPDHRLVKDTEQRLATALREAARRE
jgi:tetratricopeptide (TPR) repeat protein